MPSSIPFDHPSLVLGNVVDTTLLGLFHEISANQSAIDNAQDKMNSYITMKRSLKMTLYELSNLEIDTDDLVEKVKEIDGLIKSAAQDYMTAQLSMEPKIQQIRERISQQELSSNFDSIVDFEKSAISKDLPLASDSLKLDAQYFSYGANDETDPAGPTISKIEGYIKDTTATLGAKASSDLAKNASESIKIQQQNHSLSGTLIITASSTHRKATLISPFVVNVDKAVGTWNKLFQNDSFPDNDPSSVRSLATAASSPSNANKLTVLSGATYGSSFIGMVHILKKDASGEKSDLLKLASDLQDRFTIGGWVEGSSGGIGVDDAIVDDIRHLLSTQNISTHITLIALGAIPSIKSNEVKMGLKTFAEQDASNSTKKLATVKSATNSDKSSVGSTNEKAKTAATVAALDGAAVQNVIQGLGKLDQGSNKVLDIGSLMTAFEDYIQEIKKGDTGMPINFFFKEIAKKDLARLWLAKYFPDDNSIKMK